MFGLGLVKWVALILVAVLAQRIYKLMEVMKPYAEMNFNDKNCVLQGEMFGNEDMVLGKESVMLFAASGNLHVCFDAGSAAAGDGGIWMLYMKDSSARPKQLPIQGYPHKAFHGHGIYLSNATDRLYVVNHLGPKTVVEVMKVEYSPVRISHLKTVQSDLFLRYGMNDVIEGIDENEIYVSRWQVFQPSANGWNNPTSFIETIYPKLGRLLSMLFIPLTLVYRCDLKKDKCEAASERLFVGANGMTISPDRSTVYVADPIDKRIGVMSRTPSGFLEHQEWINLPFGVDNIEYDHQSGDILMGTIPDFNLLMKYEENQATEVPGGLSVLRREGERGTWTTHDVLMHDGSKLSQISAGVMFGRTVILGSPYSKGLLVCQV